MKAPARRTLAVACALAPVSTSASTLTACAGTPGASGSAGGHNGCLHSRHSPGAERLHHEDKQMTTLCIRRLCGTIGLTLAANDYVLPALSNQAHAKPTPARHKALARELEFASQHQGQSGAPADPTAPPKL